MISNLKITTIKIFLLVLLIAFLAWRLDIKAVIEYFDKKLLFSIILVQPLIFATTVTVAMRYAMLVSSPPAQFFKSFKAIILSSGLNPILPARLSELFKVLYLREQLGIPISQGLSGLLMVKLIDSMVFSIFIFAGIGILLNINNFITFILILLLLIAMYCMSNNKKTLSILMSKLPLSIKCFLEGFASNTISRIKEGIFFNAFFLGILSWLLSFAAIWSILFINSSHQVTLADSVKVFVAVTLGSIIPIMPGGFGTYETAGILALKNMGYGTGEAIAITIAMHFAQIALNMIYSFYIVITEKIGLHSLVEQLMSLSRAKKSFKE